MKSRLLAALLRFEDSPVGLALGLFMLFAVPLSLLALNEAGVR